MKHTGKYLIIQTAFIGDVILATSLIEKLTSFFPEIEIDFLLRRGNESLLAGHPKLRNVLVLDKKQAKYRNLVNMIKRVRREQYDVVINVQRFFTTGLITALSKGKKTIGFDKNPLSILFDQQIPHIINPQRGMHEIERNHQLIRHLTDNEVANPRLYPTEEDYQQIRALQKDRYICVAPASVWETKQFPAEKWIEFLKKLDPTLQVYVLGSPADIEMATSIVVEAGRSNIEVLAGKLNLLQSAALMEGALMNYVNDSAPMHLASAVNAPTCAIFCSTVPGFGFGPLAENSTIIETESELKCRPCGLHGRSSCPEGHFNCAQQIKTEQLQGALGNA